MAVVGVVVAAVPPFYATATTLLVVLLITWLVAEAQGLREDLAKKRMGTADAAYVRRLPRRSMLPIALGLVVGVVVALRVQFRERADSWEQIAVWSMLGLGLGAVTSSLALNVYERVELTANATVLRMLRMGKKWGAPAVALAFGVVASPFFHEQQPVRYVGTRFGVYGTCLEGGCGLKQRVGPGPGFPEARAHKRLLDGERVRVVCQTSGPSPPGNSSRVWDRLDNGNYVSDAFVDTPNRSGGFSSGVPRCDRQAPKGTVG